ncbi:MAG: VOC family protein [Fidelibacterota bacterium]
MDNKKYRYHHIGIPTTKQHKNEKYFKKLKFYHAGYEESEFGIEWMRFEKDCPLPDLIQKVPHLAFEVDDLDEALAGRKVIIAPNSPSEGIRVAFIEEDGAPIELLEDKSGN